ncbi:MAG TPA: amidohydrolase family protein [Burkholderiales bacterium]|nr:amidohydrolase family protein [Burkholderiales bacterium]
MAHDLVIRNAQLHDGLGSASLSADLAVDGGRIAALGAGVGRGREEIDAGGLALAPGIVDTHTHYDAQVTWDPFVSPSPQLGVTTAVIGNCGFTIAPCRPDGRERVMRNLTQVEGMSLDVLRRGIRWAFESFPQYLDQLERDGVGINVAAFVGHSSVRSFVMGEDAAQRTASAAEIDTMRAIVLEAMRAGAVGFSTTTSPAHNGEGGIPMPSRLASDDELRALVSCLGEVRRGVFMLTKGGHTPLPFLEELAAVNARPVIVAALLHNSTNPDSVFRELDAIAAANARGHRLIGAMSCCPLTFEFTLRSPYPFEGLDAWRPALGLSGEAYKARLGDARFRQALRDELARPAVFRLFNAEWDKLHVAEVRSEAQRAWEGKSIGEIARASRRDPLDCMLDLGLAEDLDTVFTSTLLNSDEQAVARMLAHPHSMVSLSDAGAHLTFFNDAGFGLHLLGHWVREAGALPLAEALRQLTSYPAKVFGLRGRGSLALGNHADLLLFDPATVGRGPSRRVFDLPGGAPRLTTPALGVHGVWVNGVRVVDEKGLLETRDRPGNVLRDFAA